MMHDRGSSFTKIKVQEIIKVLKEEGVIGISGKVDGFEFNIRKKEEGYRIAILPIKELLKEVQGVIK